MWDETKGFFSYLPLPLDLTQSPILRVQPHWFTSESWLVFLWLHIHFGAFLYVGNMFCKVRSLVLYLSDIICELTGETAILDSGGDIWQAPRDGEPECSATLLTLFQLPGQIKLLVPKMVLLRKYVTQYKDVKIKSNGADLIRTWRVVSRMDLFHGVLLFLYRKEFRNWCLLKCCIFVVLLNCRHRCSWTLKPLH